jgi:hypothetical protein
MAIHQITVTRTITYCTTLSAIKMRLAGRAPARLTATAVITPTGALGRIGRLAWRATASATSGHVGTALVHHIANGLAATIQLKGGGKRRKFNRHRLVFEHASDVCQARIECRSVTAER